ncbi:class I SAM-dependent methyltransferase [Bradyrhizobium sp. HKCCYLS20291]|uniref:class I SAM-dependent methyltransferase n=1 Tax=Bradyrhizobium sp. HKCCYLS20291 TaxID=3420766 RepID=UPI003EBD7319
MTSACRLCGHEIHTAALSLGRMPVCNSFSRSGDAPRRVDLDVVECETCQLVQLPTAPPPALLMPEVSWIRYREPEGHLDALVTTLSMLRPSAATAIGAGPFEQPLLSRLAARGLQTQALALDIQPVQDRHPYLESWQGILDDAHLREMSARHGTFDLVSCRYIVEHSPAPVAALRALRHLLGPNGLLLIEVPDSGKFLTARDYCFLWEEHSCYFVDATLRRLAQASGYRVVSLLRYPGALEDALVAVLEPEVGPGSALAAQGPSELFQRYRESFAGCRDQLQARLAAAAGPLNDGVALFGIGHHAIMFANAFGVADKIALAVDDDADKRGFFAPGFRIPVVGSEALLADEQVTTCLFAVAPHIESRVRDKLAPLAARGVTFHSIYAALDNAITKEVTS